MIKAEHCDDFGDFKIHEENCGKDLLCVSCIYKACCGDTTTQRENYAK